MFNKMWCNVAVNGHWRKAKTKRRRESNESNRIHLVLIHSRGLKVNNWFSVALFDAHLQVNLSCVGSSDEFHRHFTDKLCAINGSMKWRLRHLHWFIAWLNRKFNLPLLKHDVRIGIQVRHVDLLAIFKHLWMLSYAKPADVREPEASVIKKCFCFVWYEK